MRLKHFFTFILFLSFGIVSNAQQATTVKSTEISGLLKKDGKWVILDVRTPDEFKAGHLQGAINIDIRQTDALNKIDQLDHSAKYIVYCRTNHRSQVAVDHMVQSGFKVVYQMTDGFNGWMENSLKIQK
jgi:rhodanese-related sulfurtransferase